MKLGIILQSNNPEHVFNTFRLATASLEANHAVTVFLFNEGVELEDVADTDQFDISGKLSEFKDRDGTVRACRTCLATRQKRQSTVCPVATMKDLLKMIEESDKVLVFG